MSQIINDSNFYIQIATTGTGALTGANVDPKLVKADRLLAFSDSLSRSVNAAAENSLFAAGQLGANEVVITILRTPAAITAEASLIAGSIVTPISIYRTAILNKKISIVEEIIYTNNIFTGSATNAVASDESTLDTITLTFRFETRQCTVTSYDQGTGQPSGNTVSYIDFTKGGLVPPGAGGAAAPAPA